jgi:hypothetical protein
MAIESKRGCGYRKVGGIYLVMDPGGFECDRLPLELSVCPCCGEGVKFSRGFTWIQPHKLFGGDHIPTYSCLDTGFLTSYLCEGNPCPVCQPSYHFNIDGKAGLMWIGEKYYSPESFSLEAKQLGISKRVSTIPHGFKVGETWIFLAHKKGMPGAIKCDPEKEIFDTDREDPRPGIFMAFKPKRIEKIVLESDFICHREINNWIHKDDLDPDTILTRAKDRFGVTAFNIFCELDRCNERGFTLIPVPDDDPDHNPAAGSKGEVAKDAEYLPPEKCDECGAAFSFTDIIYGHPDPEKDGHFCGNCNIKHLKVEAEKIGV